MRVPRALREFWANQGRQAWSRDQLDAAEHEIARRALESERQEALALARRGREIDDFSTIEERSIDDYYYEARKRLEHWFYDRWIGRGLHIDPTAPAPKPATAQPIRLKTPRPDAATLARLAALYTPQEITDGTTGDYHQASEPVIVPRDAHPR